MAVSMEKQAEALIISVTEQRPKPPVGLATFQLRRKGASLTGRREEMVGRRTDSVAWKEVQGSPFHAQSLFGLDASFNALVSICLNWLMGTT